MNLKKTAIAFMAITVIAILCGGSTLMAQEPPIWVDVWEGNDDNDGGATGSVTWGGTTYSPWAEWWIHNLQIYASGTDNILADSSGWSDGTYSGGITGEVNTSTYAASGEWNCDNSSLHGTWSGTFNTSTDYASGTWYYYNEYSVLTYGGTFWGYWEREYRLR